jgi:hypothetical protein
MNKMLHFVGFRGDEYVRAKMLFGQPNFIHPMWDSRAVADVAEDDIVVFATGTDKDPLAKFSWDDSSRM